jgi:3-hydroxymyristoyl/3-hydroxydecanoyl-(acyl carrier protein) dehydratase
VSLVSKIRQPAEWLDDVAARLIAHAWVSDARAGLAAGGASDRVAGRTTVFILPSVEGVRALRTSGKGRITGELQRWLRAGGYADAAEAEFRLVESLPADGAGGVDADLRRSWMPLVDEVAPHEHGLNCVLHVPYELPVFRGHFPDRPIVPGVMQVGWAATLARDYSLAEGQLTGIPAAKFNRLVLPGMRLVARIERVSKVGPVQFQYTHRDTAVTTGRLQFGGGRE